MNNKRKHGKRTGSTLLMVVGFLTILALLGTTFILVSRLNKQQAESIIEFNTQLRLATGVKQEITDRILQDNWLGAARPMENIRADTPTNPVAWRRWITYPGSTDGYSQWLASYETDATSGNWPHLTNLFGAPTANVDNVATTNADLIDTDGNGTADAYLPTTSEVMDPEGNQYYITARVIDPSGLVNVSTAYDRNTAVAGSVYPVAPVYITLQGFAGGLFNQIRNAREGGTPGTISSFNTSCALKLQTPSSPYKPFYHDEEAHIRWMELASTPRVGRFYEATKDASDNPLPVDIRKYLTSWSSALSLLRNPNATITQRMDPNAIAANIDNLFAFLCGFYTAPTATQQKRIAHFLVNAWAHEDGYNQDDPYSFTIPGGDTVYGVVPQPVLTEAYVKSSYNWDAATSAYVLDKEVQCVEIHNPYGVDLTKYKLVLSDGTLIYDFSALASPAVNAWYVVYSETGTIDAAFFSPPAGAITATGAIDFKNGKNVKLVRVAGAAATEVPMDVIGVTYPEVTETGPTPDPLEKQMVNQRDTSVDRRRYLVAREKEQDAAHNLGLDNGLADADFDAAFKNGFDIPIRLNSGGFVSTGELLKVHVTGPDSTGKSLPEKLNDDFWDCPTRGLMDILDDDDGVNNKADSGYYPDMPWATLVGEIFELVPTDPASANPIIYGRVNINTAPKSVLEQLPWPDFLDLNLNAAQDAGEPTVDKATLVDQIYDYRKSTTKNFRGGNSSSIAGFLSPGEIAIPLEQYTRSILPSGVDSVDYARARDQLYQAVANVITVRSDTFVAYIVVQLKNPDPDPDEIINTWYYVSVIDRANCVTSADEPRTCITRIIK